MLAMIIQSLDTPFTHTIIFGFESGTTLLPSASEMSCTDHGDQSNSCSRSSLLLRNVVQGRQR